jgi:tetratricopeptide repeat protein/PEGA domain-containing protein
LNLSYWSIRQALKRLPVLLLFASSTLFAGNAAAQGRPSAPRAADASAHFERGTTFYTEGDYGAALIEFKRAYEASPHWQVLFNIGQCYFQLRDYANALLTLQRFANEGADRIAREDRTTIDTELPDLATRVAKVSIASNLDGAVVSLDDQVVGTTPIREPILVSAGSRKLTATHEGRAPVEQRIGVGGGDTMTLRLDFQPAAPAPPTRSDAAAAHRATTRSPSYLPVYVSAAVAAGGLATGSVFGIIAMGNKSNLDRECTAGACPTSAQRDIDTLNRNATISSVAFGVGAAGLVAGILFWTVAHSSAVEDESAPEPRSSPSIRVTHIGPGFVAGTF